MIKLYLNGIECNPKEKEQIRYILDFSERRSREVELSITSLEFVGEDFDRIREWLNTMGRFIGMPLTVEYSPTYIREYYIDFQDESFETRTRSYICPIKKYKGADSFFDKLDGTTFGSVSWLDSDFVNVDYVVVSKEQIGYYFSLSLATFSYAQELINAIDEVQQGIADLVKATTPVGVPPAPDWGAIIVASIKLLARIAYAIAIAIALIKLAVEIINALFPKIRQFKGCTVKRLMERMCSEFGVTFQSELLDNLGGLTILPVPLKEKDPTYWKELIAPQTLAYTNGFPSTRDTVITAGQLLGVLESTFNGESKLSNGVLRFEHELYFENNATVQTETAFNIQPELQDGSFYNTSEIFKRIIAVYQTDPLDFNTYDDTRKSVYELQSDVVTSTGKSYELIKGIDKIDIPFARGTRKEELTFVEKVARVFAQAIDTFTSSNITAKIDARKNVLQIENQYFDVTKLLLMSGTKLAGNQNDVIGCEAIVQNYWYSRFITNNQKDIFNSMPLAVTQEEFFTMEDNNFLLLNDGTTIKVLRAEWSEDDNVADLTYSKRKAAINEKNTVINAG